MQVFVSVDETVSLDLLGYFEEASDIVVSSVGASVDCVIVGSFCVAAT